MKRTLKHQKLKAIENFLERLQMLKIKTNNIILFTERIQNLNTSFKILLNFLKIKNSDIEIIKKENDNITIYSDPLKNIIIHVHFDLGIIKVSTGNKRLDGHIFKLLKTLSVEEVIKIYCDHKERVCDYCAVYEKNGNVPILRFCEVDYISVYHEECFKELDN
ncbi:hypothetical protein DMUE_4023 [Dictyocoela muelleri]|nr:hypothetical protein DMUE_4023 [Dictyocoela muelleri]